jgi:hypothetical protein
MQWERSNAPRPTVKMTGIAHKALAVIEEVAAFRRAAGSRPSC